MTDAAQPPSADDVTDAELRLYAGEMTADEVRACRAGYRLAMSRIERARWSAQSDARVMLNGLTEQETNETASVFGLRRKTAPASPQAAQGDLAALNPADVAFECYPATPDGGMTVGVPRGVKATHRPTGCVSIVTHHRSQHLNRDAAIAALSAAIASAQPATAKPAGDVDLSELDRAIETLRRDDEHGLYDGLCELRKRLTGGSHD